MEFTTANKYAAIFLSALLASEAGAASLGLNTRDQNPMLQAYYLPSIDIQKKSGWHMSHSLFITNTFQKQKTGNERLRIDVENYRYDFSLAYQSEDWRIQTAVPFITNDNGSLDHLIETWHDIFGLPQGGRTKNSDGQINMFYTRDGNTVFQQNNPDSDLGDISVSFNYRLTHTEKNTTELGIGAELPSGSIESNSGNESTDVAIWVSKARKFNDKTTFYGLLGISFIGEGGQLENRLKDRVWLAQFGSEYDFYPDITGILQFDFHTAMLKNTDLDAFGNSLQAQFGLQFKNWFDEYHIDLFFSEDIMVKSAPDITFGLRASHIGFD